jgi:hypothetical protein
MFLGDTNLKTNLQTLQKIRELFTNLFVLYGLQKNMIENKCKICYFILTVKIITKLQK